MLTSVYPSLVGIALYALAAWLFRKEMLDQLSAIRVRSRRIDRT